VITPERLGLGPQIVLVTSIVFAYVLIFGTVYVPDNRPAYEVRVKDAPIAKSRSGNSIRTMKLNSPSGCRLGFPITSGALSL
jgi:hypothetical protein